jgi:hypothetical protein
MEGSRFISLQVPPAKFSPPRPPTVIVTQLQPRENPTDSNLSKEHTMHFLDHLTSHALLSGLKHVILRSLHIIVEGTETRVEWTRFPPHGQYC